MVQGEHLDEVWRAALAASGDQDVAEAVTTAVLCAAPPEAKTADLVRHAVLAAVRQTPAPVFAAMEGTERDAVALARIAGCPVGEVAATLGVGDGGLEAAGSLVLFEFDPAEAPEAAAERFEPLLAGALRRGHSALWYSRFPIGPGATEFAGATAYDRAWDARFRGRPVITLCPYVLAGEDAGERTAHLNQWHDAVLDPEGRVAR